METLKIVLRDPSAIEEKLLDQAISSALEQSPEQIALYIPNDLINYALGCYGDNDLEIVSNKAMQDDVPKKQRFPKVDKDGNVKMKKSGKPKLEKKNYTLLTARMMSQPPKEKKG